MFRAIVETQWKWTRGMALLMTLAGFALPLLTLETARGEPGGLFVDTVARWGVWYAVLAFGVGLMIAVPAWTHDQRGRHVYALSLPIPRWRYALMRFGAGMLFLLAPAAGVLAGSLVVAVSGQVPEGLHAYPLAMSLRFLLASGVAFSIFFAMCGSTTKTAASIIGALVGLLLIQFIVSMANSNFSVLGQVVGYVFAPPGGLLSVFLGRWMLIDA